MHRPTLSCAVIAKNEENNVRQWFNSIQGLFDEVIFVDTGSTDKTVEIATELGCKVFHFDWINDFAAARNFAFEQATSDYVFWNDLDDVLEDPENFATWRDEIMHLADFWMANYIYSSHSDGRPACTFVRERVIKRNKGMKWKYFVHEGITPPEGTKIQFIPSWRIRHKRTEADLLKDRSRNLTLFEKHTSRMDNRMLFYWGKEYFEANRHLDAIEKLKECLKGDLEMHDRMLAMQYLAMSYMIKEEYARALDLAMTGIQLAPQRAEYYVLVGDAYLKMNQLQNSIPFFHGAAQCVLPQGNGFVSPIFFNADAYGVYPKNQLARVYANLGDLEKAKSIATQAYTDHKHTETKQILDELNRITSIVSAVKTAKPCEDIVFTGTPTSPYVWDGDEYRTKGMGGSETACIEMAEWMAKLSGCPVKVFNARPDVKTVNGVQYLPVTQVNQYMAENKPYLHVAWRHNIKLTDAPTFVWCHDLLTPGIEQNQNYQKAICLTPFHADFMHNMQLVPYDNIWVSRNGIRPERFEGPKVKKNPNKIVFPSSPDRGLDRAMLVLDEVRKEFPEIDLHVFYGIEHLPQWGHAALHDKLTKMFAERPWVKYHGKTEQTVLTEHFKEAALWLHPCDFIETSCITAMEMIASGVYPVTRRLGGLKDTLKEAEDLGLATLLDCDCVTPGEFLAYTQATLQALRGNHWERPGFKEFDPKSISWESVARSWLAELPKMITNQGGLVRGNDAVGHSSHGACAG